MAELRWVQASLLVPNPWNPNRMDPEMYAKERASIHRFGFVDPVTVREIEQDVYEIIDGEHRWRAAQDEGVNDIPIFDLGVLDDDVARQLTIVLNETRGQSDPRKLGALLRDLSSRMDRTDLLATLPFSKEAFDRLTGMTKIDWSDIEPPKLPTRAPNTWVERIYRMPAESAAVLDQAIQRWHDNEDDEEHRTPDWAVLEFLAADYLGS